MTRPRYIVLRTATSFAVLFLLLLATVAYAQTPDAPVEQNALTRFVEMAFEIIAGVLLVVATWLARKGVKLVENKFKIDVPEKIENRIDSWVDDGIAYAEEKARAALSRKTQTVTGPEKLEMAADFVLDLIEQRGFDDWTRDRIKAKIEAKLNKKR